MNSKDRLVFFMGIGVFITMMLTSFVFGGELPAGSGSGGVDTGNPFEGLELQSGSSGDSGELNTGASAQYPLAESGRVITTMTVRLSWSDESSTPRPSVFQYENEPDQFTVSVADPYGNTSSQVGRNVVGQPGTIEVEVVVPESTLKDTFKEGNAGSGNWTVSVSMDAAGNWVPVRLPGIILGFQDTGNSFSLTMDYDYYDLTADEGEG
ncbi:MAG: hypothetical protein ACMUIE_00880 [Thermoplasmatota archaeon]